MSAPASARKAFAGVRRPRPLLPAEAERELTDRQREILDWIKGFISEQGLPLTVLCGKDPLARLALKTKQVGRDEWQDQVASFAQKLKA